MTNVEMIIRAVKECPKDRFVRRDLFDPFPNALSPAMSFLVRSGLLTKESKSIYWKTETIKEDQVEDLCKKVAKVWSGSRSEGSGTKRGAEPETVEVDLYQILDELSLEVIFDVLSAKFNALAAQPRGLLAEIGSLKDIIYLRDATLKSAEVDRTRIGEKLGALMKENAKLQEELARFMPPNRPQRLVMAKSLSKDGTGVFRDLDKGVIKVYRKGRHG